MPERAICESDIAMLRGVRNCGQHHEENSTSPAVMFANGCASCAGLVFSVIFNYAAQRQYDDIVMGRRL